MFHGDVLPSNLEPFQVCVIPGATVPSEYFYFSFVLLHNSLHSLLQFFFFQIRRWRLINRGLFWDSALATKLFGRPGVSLHKLSYY